MDFISALNLEVSSVIRRKHGEDGYRVSGKDITELVTSLRDYEMLIFTQRQDSRLSNEAPGQRVDSENTLGKNKASLQTSRTTLSI